MNLDIQLVHNYYKARTYIAAYFLKSEALKLAVRGIENQNLNVFDTMKKLHILL